MKKRTLIQTVALCAALAVGAQVNSPTAEGYLARGEGMYNDKNYNGCLDQLQHIDRSVLSPVQLEQVDWLMAQSAYHTVGAASMAYFRLFMAEYPSSLLREQALMRIGDCLYYTDYAKALATYLTVDPRCLPDDLRSELGYRKAYCYLRLAEYDSAAEGFAALASDSEYGNSSRFYLGYIDYLNGDYDKAVERFRTVSTATQPGNMADYYLAQIYYKRADYQQAIKAARAVIKRRDVDEQYIAEANRIAGEALYQTGKVSEALPYLRTYVEMAEQPALTTLYILGVSEYGQGNYEAALAALQPATALEDASGQSAYLYVGQALLKQDAIDAAMLAFDKASRMDYDKDVAATAAYNYAVAKSRGGKIPFGSSVATFEDFLTRYPGSPYAKDVERYIVNGYLTDGNYERALEAIGRIKQPDGEMLAAKQHILYTLGAQALRANQPEKALEYLTDAKALASHSAAVAMATDLVLGETYYALGRYTDAEKSLGAYLRAADKKSADYGVGLYDMGYALMAQKRYKEAGNYFSRLLDQKPAPEKSVLADTYNRLGDVAYYESDFARAARYYGKAYDANPAAGDYALFQKAVMKGYSRDHRGKIADLDSLRAAFPSSALIPEALLEATESYIQLGDNNSAIATYRTLIDTYPSTEQGRKAYLQLAQTLINTGRTDEAVATYKEVISLYPTGDEARQATEALKVIYTGRGQVDEFLAFMSGVDNAPKIDIAEADRLTYDAAEQALAERGDDSLMRRYLADSPDGAYRANALYYLMQAEAEAGRRDKAADFAAELINRYPDNSLTEDALIISAQYDFEEGRGQAALDKWRRLEQRASSPRVANTARMGIIRAAQDTGDFQIAVDAADALLASSTAGAETRNEATFARALALDNMGRSEEARAAWAELASDTDDIYGAKSAFYRAGSFFDDDLLDEAAQAAEKFTDSGTPHIYWLARGFILLSDVYAAQGKNFEAREYLEALRENYPGKESDIYLMIETRLNSLK